MTRADGREPNQLRDITFKPKVNPYAEGSCEVRYGNTVVHVTASIETERPRWMKDSVGGWITAEYGMLPRSTHTRNNREAAKGGQGGRTQEIQRLIGRSLRAAVDLRKIDGLTIRLDCDVLLADGGTRTAAISGGWVALVEALHSAKRLNLLTAVPTIQNIAAVSAGTVSGTPMLDLAYEEDSAADFDLNLVFNAERELIEIQGTGERTGLSFARITELVRLGEDGAEKIMQYQRQALAALEIGG